MPYTMTIYPDELERCPIPRVGDTFVVTFIDDNVTDMHWGECTHIKLRRLPRAADDATQGDAAYCDCRQYSPLRYEG